MKKMTRPFARLCRTAGFCLLIAGLSTAAVAAEDWQKATTLPGVDMGSLNANQKAAVLRVMRAQACSCGCSMRMAECRVKDPTCAYSKGMSDVVISAVKAGKNDQQSFDAATASKWGHIPEAKLLEDAVAIPVSGSPVLGPASAKIEIVEFSDFQCPYCVLAFPQIHAALKAYPTTVKLVFKQFPLEIHSQAFLAASAALAANKQGKFWQMHDAMFVNHDDLSKESILKLAQGLGLDLARLQTDMNSDEVKQAIEKDVNDGDHAGVQGTPTIFINGQRYNGPIRLDALKPVLDAAMGETPKAHSAAAR